MTSGLDTQDVSHSLELVARAASSGFTPGAKDIPLLLQLLATAGEADAKHIMRALLRAGAASIAPLMRVIPDSVRPVRGLLTSLAGKLAEQTSSAMLKDLLLTLVTDADLKTQLNAITALGRLPGDDSEQALLSTLTQESRSEVVRAATRSLGKVGGKKAQAALAAREVAKNEDVHRRAQLIITRELSRREGGEVAAERPLAKTQTVWLSCRAGLEGLLADEARAAGFNAVAITEPGLVTVEHDGPLTDFWRLRLALCISLPVIMRGGKHSDLIAALTSQVALTLLQSLTIGPVRYRLDLPSASKAELWKLAQQLTTKCPQLVNDPTASVWEVGMRRVGPLSYLELIPKNWVDPRFTYRLKDVPAASHPTIAAALARVAGVRADDCVWDPFVGSGSELIERYKLGPVAALYGTDLDPRALSAAASNTAAAGCSEVTTLEEADSLTWNGPRPTLTITNPPMGRRVHRGSLHKLFEALIPKLAEHLAPGGRLVWLSPLPAETRSGLSALGLKLAFAQLVDMGGFQAELQRWEKL
jgi:23S rRNA G2445 N2-methylase RlmL